MSQSILIESSSDRYRRPGLSVYISDFANVLKAFVGSNFISIPFAFGQSGLALGVAGLVLIAVLTAHCCQLLVKCKYHAIQHVTHLLRHPTNYASRAHRNGHLRHSESCSTLHTDHLVSDWATSGQPGRSVAVKRRLVKSMVYGDVAHMCLGKWGLMVTNVLIVITQVGFCLNYAVFTANALMTFFPVYNCTVQLHNSTTVASPDCRHLPDLPWKAWEISQLNKSRTFRGMDVGNIETVTTATLSKAEVMTNTNSNPHEFTSPGVSDLITTLLAHQISTSQGAHFSTSTSQTEKRSTSTSVIAGSSNRIPKTTNDPTSANTTPASGNVSDESIAAFTSSEGTFSANLPTSSAETTAVLASTEADSSSSTTSSFVSINPSTVAATLSNSVQTSAAPYFRPEDPTSTNTLPAKSSQTLNIQNFPAFAATAILRSMEEEFSDPTAVEEPSWTETWTNAPDLRLMVLFPVAVFLVLVLPRKLRGFGVVSAIGNLALLAGAFIIIAAVIASFRLSDSWQWARLEGLPLFVGTVASAFEGAGTIMAVEGSMDGNRHNFASFLAGGIAFLTALHVVLSMLSYLSFGDAISQMVTMNIAAGSGLSVVMNICFIIGVLFTFPIMVFPVVRIAESALLGGACCKTDTDSEDNAPLLPDKEKHIGVPLYQQAAAWKRNLVRVTVVLIIGVLAVLLRNSFAYISAFIGALGSTFVAFVLPCVFHLRLCWPFLSLPIKLKDMSIIVVGVVFCVTGVYSVMKDMIA
ncbi:hypothetical protein V1264_011118 [Littorina saxatilis]|uniref:Amino acid transporter transmembrane domain-containing protein n=1 Tax=Littorina saxatilis TaxID=31220 RepID=A0AAN9GK45_9CAEN